jgi:flavin reductase (DIM6/NTAB) family NADH-FMN oxidoreductase RutF
MNAMALSPVAAEDFVGAMGMAATAVSVITSDGPGGRCGLTVSAVSSVSSEPPLILFCINRKSRALPVLEANGIFAVNLLAVHNQAYAETFSGRPSSGKPFDFDGHRWQIGRTGLPLVSDATAIFECENYSMFDAGTHRVIVGRVLAAHKGDAEPLIYCNRAYRRIAVPEGKDQ